MRCGLCSGLGLVLVAAKSGYHIQKACPACKGHGTLPPPPPKEEE